MRFLLSVLLSSLAVASVRGATVSNAADLTAALAAGDTSITLNPGDYTVASDSDTFVVTTPNTVITALPGAQITCGGSNTAIGLNVARPASGVSVTGLTVKNCGTGVQIAGSSASFSNVDVRNNFNNIGLGSGFHVLDTGSVNITNSQIVENTGNAAIFVYGILYISNSNVSANSGGGILSRYGGQIYVASTAVNGNQGSGVFATEGSTVRISNSSVSNNTGAYVGGGIGAINSNVQIDNSVVSGNSATNNAGGIFIDSGSSSNTVITNTDVSSNQSPQTNEITFPPGAPVVVTNSTISEPGNNDIPSYCCADNTNCYYPPQCNSVTSAPTSTPSPTPAPTPAATPAPTPAATPAPTPAATPAPTPAATPAPTPAATPAPTSTPAPGAAVNVTYQMVRNYFSGPSCSNVGPAADTLVFEINNGYSDCDNSGIYVTDANPYTAVRLVAVTPKLGLDVFYYTSVTACAADKANPVARFSLISYNTCTSFKTAAVLLNTPSASASATFPNV